MFLMHFPQKSAVQRINVAQAFEHLLLSLMPSFMRFRDFTSSMRPFPLSVHISAVEKRRESHATPAESTEHSCRPTGTQGEVLVLDPPPRTTKSSLCLGIYLRMRLAIRLHLLSPLSPCSCFRRPIVGYSSSLEAWATISATLLLLH